ncbi:MAG: AAA family ATPase, partial [Planctomycetaceae bacterium]|nr:AAA family ATPase [Planctomycetaceae bacterium]
MKITRIHVDQFGNWRDLNLAPLNAGINVFYGPNETGKSTLMRMIRGILYGFQTEEIREQSRVSDDIPWSALLDIKHKGQRYEIRRQTSAKGRGTFSFRGESGNSSNLDLLTSLHAGVQESVFENVFAIGLNELQELGTLHGDQVAEHIYGLTLGPEGQAILDASSRLNQSRQTLLSSDFKSGKLVDLYRQLDELNSKLTDQEHQAQRFFNLSSELQNLRAESDSLKKRKTGLQYQIRGHRFLDRVWKPWQEVQDLHQKLRQVPLVHNFPDDGVAQLDEYERELKQAEAKLTEVKAEIKRLRAEIEQYELDNELLNFAPNIQSLADQKTWIAELEQQHQAGESHMRDLEQTLAKHLKPNQSLSDIVHIRTTPDNNQRLINAARAYRLAAGKRKNAHQRYKKVSRRYQQTLAQLQEQSSRLIDGHSIDEELQRARERMKHLERLSQLRFRESELLIRQESVKEQLAGLQSHARIPSWAKKTLFGFALAGILLIIAGFWRGVSDAALIGLIFCLSGTFLGGTTWALKKHFEINLDDQTESLQDEIWALDVHLRETRQEIDRILEDEYFSLKLIKEGHSLTSHKHQAKVPSLKFNDENILRTELLHELALKIAELEQLKAAQERSQKTRQLLVKLRNRSQEIQRQFSGKRHEWCECLKQLGLTETLKTDEAFQMWHQVSNANLYADQLNQEQRRIKPMGDLIGMFYSRVRDLGLRMNRDQHDFDRTFEVISEWERELDALSGQRKERTRLRKEEKRLQQEADALQLTIQELKQHRSGLLIQGSASNREEFLQRAAALQERIHLEKLLASAQSDLEKISQSEQEMAIVEEDLLNFNPEENAEHLEMLTLELEDIEQDLVTTAENMGRLKQDYQNAKTDRSAAELRFQREQIREQIRQAGENWFTAELSAVGLNQLRSEYERTSQPETL